jgi:hypothetical protein
MEGSRARAQCCEALLVLHAQSVRFGFVPAQLNLLSGSSSEARINSAACWCGSREPYFYIGRVSQVE